MVDATASDECIQQGEKGRVVGIAVEVFPEVAIRVVYDVLGTLLILHIAAGMHIQLVEI